MSNYLEELTNIVRKKYGREAEHMQTVLVKEIVEETLIWDGAVEVFGLRWNAKASRCYAWGQPKAEGGWDVTTVLGIRSVASPRSAVKAAIAANVKPFAA